MSAYRPLDDLMKIWAPTERASLSDWAEANFALSPEYSAKSGLFDAYTDPDTYMVVLMTATQMVKTLFLQVTAAFDICEDPGPLLFVGYKDDDARKFAKERFEPMVRDIPALHAKISPAKSRDASNTTTHKKFRGGTIEFVGSLAPANLGRRTIRYLKFDEVDQYDQSSGKQGHAVDLGMRRTVKFGSRRKIIIASSPTIRGQSRIGQAYDESDRRKGFVGCHHCGVLQLLTWNQVIFDSSLHIADAAASARYQCAHCGESWTDQERRRNIHESFEWQPTNALQDPSRGGKFEGRAGFWISHLYSRDALHSLGGFTREWLESKNDRERRRVFINTDLAELWEEEGERPDHERLMARAEPYAMGADAPVHERVVFLMAGVDVQAKRLEIQVLGFGPDADGHLHIWVVDYRVIELFEGETSTARMTTAPQYWEAMEGVLNSRYRHSSGGPDLPIIGMAIDVGHNPEPVYTFAKRFPQPTYGPLGLEIHTPRTVLCVRGYDTDSLNAIHRVTEREAARTRKGPGQDIPIITLGTGYLKTNLYAELMGRSDLKRVHMSAQLEEHYFRGVVSEKRVVSAKGEVSWEKIYPRNEPLDTFVYAWGGAHVLKVDRFDQSKWAVMRRKMGIAELQRADTKQDTARVKLPGRVVPSPYL